MVGACVVGACIFAWLVCCVGGGFDVFWLGGLLLVVSCGVVG